ncbi:putative two-component system response regulator [Rhodovulum sp. PH10]|uniref:helix-turn-helix transcriptional regulator n=1 Tax=Rhodovulum sp. PH10 TaxID=1187851 RepID=UPI00027C2CF0|nr:response regulator transcription factor [Rhodovulum sp. PH10]EJW11590.1 putative two-component system response regulator [Rhodovulum sp. PH10]
MTASEELFHDLPVYAAQLDRFGFILRVNPQWKAFVDAGGLVLPHGDQSPADYGIGENYLRFCAFADPLSPRLITGISQVLAGQVDCISILYPRPMPGRRGWFMLFAFPQTAGDVRAMLLHIDVGEVMSRMSAGAEDEPADLEAIAGRVEAAVAGAVAVGREPPHGMLARGPGEDRPAPLSKRQWEVLSLMTNGLTNVEIARRLGLSPNTVKIHVSGILARLGLPSRTQAVHWALTEGRHERPPG